MSLKFDKEEYDKWILSHKEKFDNDLPVKIYKTIKTDILLEEKDKNNFLLFLDYPNLPINGWIHPCIKCDLLTSNEYFYCNYNDKNIYLNKCTDCKINNNIKNLIKFVLYPFFGIKK